MRALEAHEQATCQVKPEPVVRRERRRARAARPLRGYRAPGRGTTKRREITMACNCGCMTCDDSVQESKSQEEQIRELEEIKENTERRLAELRSE